MDIDLLFSLVVLPVGILRWSLANLSLQRTVDPSFIDVYLHLLAVLPSDEIALIIGGANNCAESFSTATV